jgi:DNA-binding CsgD family transcriptional regulator
MLQALQNKDLSLSLSTAKLFIMKQVSNDVNTSFSKREREIADLLSRGYTEKEIADKLCISPATVNNHTRNMRERFGLHKNSELVLLYIAQCNREAFNIHDIRKYGISIILVLVNVCYFNKGF